MAGKKKQFGRWSLSEFLNLLELRSQTWCFVEIDSSAGFRIPHNDAHLFDTLLFYAVLKGTAKLTGTTSGMLNLSAGDIVMVLGGDAHAICGRRGSEPNVLEFLHNGEYVDVPPNIMLGPGAPAARLLCGRLKVRWPGGQHPPALPHVLSLKFSESLINFEALEQASSTSGAAAVLTRAATLLFTVAFRDHPQSELIFRESAHDPIARARQLIQAHPFTDWTVARLAHKVAMGRSSFAARFVLELGKTPIEVVTEERMKLAINFLEKSDLKIAEIGERTGYRSEAAFSRRFTSYFGMSPGKMRKGWREAHAESRAPARPSTLQ